MIYLHFAIACCFFVVGFAMRFGFWRKFTVLFHQHIPKLRKKEFDEFDVRFFVGETSIKLGFILFLIAGIGLVDPKNFHLAIPIGWTCFFIYALASITFIDKVDIFGKRRREKQKAKIERTQAEFDAWNKDDEDRE